MDLMEPMEIQSLRDLVGLMLAADGPRVIPARISWPLHEALRELDREARQAGLCVGAVSFRASPDVGIEAQGADRAIFGLMQEGALVPEGTGRQAEMHADLERLTAFRRDLMRLSPRTATLIHRAGTRWAALVATSAKNRSTARRSSDSTLSSGTPNRLQPLPGKASTPSSDRRPLRSTRLVTR
jgi:hypothetical protein